MIMSEHLIDQIYEAAFVPEKWPDVLGAVAALSGSASGAVLSISGSAPPQWRATPLVQDALRNYVETGQWQRCERPMAMLSMNYAGFLRDEDFLTPEQIERDPARKARIAVRLGAQAGTLVAMPSGEIVGFTFERWIEDGRHDQGSVTRLDGLRPHLARAGLLAARLGLERAQTAVKTLEAIGLPAAVLSGAGRMLAANALLEASDFFLPVARDELRLSDAVADKLFRASSSTVAGSHGSIQSIPIAASSDRAAAILHVLPLRGDAHDLFSGAAAMVILTSIGMSVNAPDMPLLRALFDLSPAEAKLAAALSSGRTLKQAADDARVRVSTARSYMENIFRKTGTHQQSQLVALLKSAQPLARNTRVAAPKTGADDAG
jgi:DNA-binding CsgD family transcriptional regulator